MPPRSIHWGLLSTARINERLIPAIRGCARSELLAVASQSGPERAARYAAERSIPRAYGSYEALLADPEVDVVYISLPNALHLPWAVKAAEAGKHILCEKPLALTAMEVDRMAEAVDRNGVVLQEAVMMRFHPQTIQLQKRVAEGAIGDVRLIRGVFTFTLARPGDIRFDPSLGGGSIWDVGSYPVSFMRTMLSADPVEVHGWQVLGDGGSDLSFSGQMRFACGALTQFFSSFQSVPQASADLIGSSGTIHLDLPYVNKVGVTSRVRICRVGENRSLGTFGDASAQLEEEILTYENVNGYQHEVESMVACVLDGAEPVVYLADSRGNVATLGALCTSALENRPVRLEQPTHRKE
jgi:D-xylose 1-dehydrogenase (NADP+, D-xylono-1,5-lactone-forming)